MGRTICQAIDYGGRTGGSFIAAMESLARALVRRGDRCVVFARNVAAASWPAELERAGAEVRLVERDGEVAEGLRALQPSAVSSHFTRFDLPVLHGARGARIFWHAHSYRQNRSATAFAKAVIKYRVLGRGVERLVAVSNAVADECIAFGAPAGWVRVVRNGIDVDRFRPPAPYERQAARLRLGLGRYERAVLFFDRTPQKGGKVLREALDRLPSFRPIVVGGSAADRALFGPPPRTIAIERVADPRSVYWAADILAFPSENEAFGLVLAEALACGLPAVASDIPIVREIRAECEQVGLFPPGDAPAMARSLERLAGKTGTSGRERIVRHFDLERWTNEMLQLYNDASPDGQNASPAASDPGMVTIA